MSINSKLNESPFATTTYPRLMKHDPTGCIVLFIAEGDGVLISNPMGISNSAIGARWNMVKSCNYAVYQGSVTLTNNLLS